MTALSNFIKPPIKFGSRIFQFVLGFTASILISHFAIKCQFSKPIYQYFNTTYPGLLSDRRFSRSSLSSFDPKIEDAYFHLVAVYFWSCLINRRASIWSNVKTCCIPFMLFVTTASLPVLIVEEKHPLHMAGWLLHTFAWTVIVSCCLSFRTKVFDWFDG